MLLSSDLNFPRTADVAILDNSLRLYRDAKLLFDHGRYASSTALAILSLEEFGKFLDHIGLAGRSNHKLLHLKRQAFTAKFFISVAYRVTVLKVFNIDGELTLNKKLRVPVEKMSTIKPYVELDEPAMDMGIFQTILETEPYKSALVLFCRFYDGDLNRLKNRAFYVDVSDFSILSDPITVDRDTAEWLLRTTYGIQKTFGSLLPGGSKDFSKAVD